MYRYYESKMDFILAISAWKWSEYWEKIKRRLKSAEGQYTAVQEYAFFLNAFVEIYQEAPDILRFNLYMNNNVHSQTAGLKPENPLSALIDQLADRFRLIWVKAESDGTLRTDVPWVKVFSASLHIMLATATRYAVGLLYHPPEGMDPVAELEMLKNLLLNQFATHKRKGEENSR